MHKVRPVLDHCEHRPSPNAFEAMFTNHFIGVGARGGGHVSAQRSSLSPLLQFSTTAICVCLFVGDPPKWLLSSWFPFKPTKHGRNPAPPKKPWNDDSLVNTNKQGFSWFQDVAGFRPSTVYPPNQTYPFGPISIFRPPRGRQCLWRAAPQPLAPVAARLASFSGCFFRRSSRCCNQEP